MKFLLASTSALLFLPSILLSQAASRIETSGSQNDVFVGAAFNGSNPTSNTAVGFMGGADFHLIGPLGADAQVAFFSDSGNGTNTITLVDFVAGPRVQAHLSSRVVPFADFLVGGQTLKNSSTQHTYYYANGAGLAAAGDVGADLRLAHRIAFRSQAGFLFSNFAVASGGPVGNYRWRAGAGLVYRF